MQANPLDVSIRRAAPPETWGDIRRGRHPDIEAVNEWLWRDTGQRLDITAYVDEPNNVLLLCGEGGAMFAWRGPGIFEVHCFFTQRGREVLEISRRMLEIMRVHYGAKMVWCAIPNNPASRKVKWYVRQLGFRALGHTYVAATGPSELFQLDMPQCRLQ